MSIETVLEKLTAAIEANTAALLSGEDAPKKTRGRPAKGEENGKAVVPEKSAEAKVAPESLAASAVDIEAPKQVGDKEVMKKAVLAYRDATDQDTALKLLTDVGAENFGAVNPALYQQVTDAAVAALAALKPAAKTLDPFGDEDETPAAPAVELKDVKAAFVKRQKDVSEAALLEVLKQLGAIGQGAPGTPPAPSLKYLAADKYAAAIAAVNALPKTK